MNTDALGTAYAFLRRAKLAEKSPVGRNHLSIIGPVVSDFVGLLEANTMHRKSLKATCQEYWQGEFGYPLPQHLSQTIDQLTEELRDETSICVL